MISGVNNLVLLPLPLYYFLLDWRRWSSGTSKSVPRRLTETYMRISNNMDEVLGEFLRGQLMVMMTMGLVCGLGLMLVGLGFSLTIGMTVGILAFIPYLGAFTGLLLAIVAALLQCDSWQGLLTV